MTLPYKQVALWRRIINGCSLIPHNRSFAMWRLFTCVQTTYQSKIFFPININDPTLYKCRDFLLFEVCTLLLLLNRLGKSFLISGYIYSVSTVLTVDLTYDQKSTLHIDLSTIHLQRPDNYRLQFAFRLS